MPSSDPLSYFQQITDNQQAILQELQAIHSTLKKQNSNKQIRRTSRVNSFVAELITKNPYQNWTAESLAKMIGNGCTASAVKKTAYWKAYRKTRQTTPKNHRLTGVAYDNTNEIDESIDRKTGK
ncbi:MAG: hypothetical protein LBG58_04365 [Planctomycetaceae bacterium]|nr:hypothetical protein [Planctomycetaceae bacterium]